MLHPHTELRFIHEQIGYGIVATHFIPRGTVTWVRDDFDQAFALAQVERMAPLYRDIVAKYCFVDSRGDFVLCWDLARYINHACDSSCRSAGYDFELAVRDIHPGEELTDDHWRDLRPFFVSTANGSALDVAMTATTKLVGYDRSITNIDHFVDRLVKLLHSPQTFAA